MKFSQPIHIIAARRTPMGKLGGALSQLSAVDLALAAAQGVLAPLGDAVGDAAEIEARDIESVTFGQVLQAGVGMNLARQVALRAGCRVSTPAFTVNMVCGSGAQAIALASREIESGEIGLALAGGAESMSNAPHYLHLRQGKKLGEAKLEDAILRDGLTDPLHSVHMALTAERLAEKFDISRRAQDEFALQSHQRAVAAQEKFAREMVAVETRKGTVMCDESPRADTSLEKLSALAPAFEESGSITAGNASGINDGAAAVLISGEAMREKLGLVSRARIIGSCVVGCEPLEMGLGPVGATRKLCADIGWELKDVGAIEINEAFAAQTLACARELNLDPETLNRRGGAIALGHPIGCSGARVLVSLLHIMEDENLERGIATLCVGGGMGIAVALQR